MRQAVRRRRFLPFASLGAVGELRIEGVRLDGRTVRLGAVPPDAVIALQDYPSPKDTVEVDVAVSPPDGLAGCLVDGEGLDAVAAVAIVEDASCWYRAPFALRPRNGEFAGTVIATARAFDHRFEITGVLVRAEAAERVRGRAWEKGARLASTPPRTVALRPGRPLRGGLLDVRPAAFSTAEALRRWAGQPWYLQVTADPPVLWLNEELPEVAAVLLAKGTTGKRARLRDLLFRSIALQAWTTLFHAAAAGVSREDGEVVYALPWHEAVLRVVAEHALPELPRGERLPRLLEHVADAGVHADHLGLLLEEVGLGLQRQVDLAAVVEKAAEQLFTEPT